jgi:hypothetical protein
MAAKLTRLTHKIAIHLHLVAESCTIYSSRSSRENFGYTLVYIKYQKYMHRFTIMNKCTPHLTHVF